jgi:hypothetical protein
MTKFKQMLAKASLLKTSCYSMQNCKLMLMLVNASLLNTGCYSLQIANLSKCLSGLKPLPGQNTGCNCVQKFLHASPLQIASSNPTSFYGT